MSHPLNGRDQMPTDPVTPPTAPAGPSPRRAPAARWAWPLAFVAVSCFVLATAFLLIKGCVHQAGRSLEQAGNHLEEAARRITSLFKPQVNINTAMFAATQSLRQESKLVVLTANINVEIVKQSEKNATIFGKALPLGTTTVRLRTLDNKIQYYLPLAGLSTNRFAFDSQHRRVVVRLPAPVLDEDMVEVQSDPSKIDLQTTLGWARLDSHSGQFLREEAKRELRPAILAEGRRDLYRGQARENAQQSIKRLLQPLKDALQADVVLDIVFE